MIQRRPPGEQRSVFGRARRVPRVAPVVTTLAAIALIGATCGVAQAPSSGDARPAAVPHPLPASPPAATSAAPTAASVAAAPAPRQTEQSRVPAPAVTTTLSAATPVPTVEAAIVTPPPLSARSTFDPAGLAVMGSVGFVVLDDPAMIPVGDATWLRTDDIVLGVVHPSGEAHAFPIKQMAYHHIANTTVSGQPHLVTY